jgi:ASC-1-like (ASCH) protein
MLQYHLVILKKPYLDAILAGTKTVESRFMKAKCCPFGRITEGDKLFFKISSGPVCATAVAAKVRNFDNLTPEKITAIKKQYNHLICGGDDYWQSKADSSCGFWVLLKDVREISPRYIDKKDWRAWVVLTKENNFGLLNKATQSSVDK